jgi:regulator of sigma E protease
MMVFYWGESYLKLDDAKYGMVVDSLGLTLGLQDGDKVISAGGVALNKFSAGLVSKEIIINQAKDIVVERQGQKITLNVPSELVSNLTKYENKGKALFYPRVMMNVMDVDTSSAAAKAGLKPGDNIISVNGNPVSYQHEFRKAIKESTGKEVDLAVVKAQDTTHLKMTVSDKGTIGIKMQPLAFSTEKFGLMTSFAKGSLMAVNFLGDQLKAFGQIFTGKIKAKDSLGSVFSIATMFDSGWDWRVFWNITASLSILLAFFNLLPIPALDGGYVVFLLWEVITGKVPGDRFMEIVNYVGFIILMALMVFALGLDISRWF